MEWNRQTERPQPLEWLFKYHDDTGIDNGSEHTKQNSCKTGSDGTIHYEILEFIYSIWTGMKSLKVERVDQCPHLTLRVTARV